MAHSEDRLPGLDYSKNYSHVEVLKSIQDLQNDDSTLLKRAFKEINGVDGKPVIRILQWNILAQGLSIGKDNFIKCPTEVLAWDIRRLNILYGILCYDPDVVCLEEVDHYEFLSSALGCVGYEGFFCPKPDSPCLYTENSDGPDGCAVFYKTEKLRLKEQESVTLKNSNGRKTNQVAIYVVLETVDGSRQVSVAATHLKAKPGSRNASIRFEQGKDLLQYLSTKDKDCPLVVCGDFNADSSEPIISAFQDSELDLVSAYRSLSADGLEPPYTTWKIRGSQDNTAPLVEVAHTIDYIWHTKQKLAVHSLLEFPSGEEIGENRLPSAQYPSDHLALVADFIIS